MADQFLTFVPILTFTASLILLVLGTYQLLNPSFVFWPPPEDQRWKKVIFMTLFRIVVYGLIIASALYIWNEGLDLSTPGLPYLSGPAILLEPAGLFHSIDAASS